MTKKAALLFSILLATIAFVFLLIIDVLNPHSFLDPLGALIRVIVILVLTFAWAKICPSEFSKIRLYGIIILFTMAVIYTYLGASLLKDEILWKEIESNRKA